MIAPMIEKIIQLAKERDRHRDQYAAAEADLKRALAEYKAAIVRRPWWWRLLGRDHVSPETRAKHGG